MKTTILWGLIGLNVLLLAALFSRYVKENAAEAQAVRGAPGDYIICPGAITGLSNEVVYIIDATSGQLGCMAFDVNGNRLDAMAPNDLNRVFQVGVGPAGTVAPGVPGSVPPGTLRR